MAQETKVHITGYNQNVGTLLECLRYASVIGNVKHEYKDDEDGKGYYSFDIYAPKNVNYEAWADMNAERMRSFMIRAKSELVE